MGIRQEFVTTSDQKSEKQVVFEWIFRFGRLPNAAKWHKSGSPGRQPWDRFQRQDKLRSTGRASDSAAPAGLEYTCTRTPSACALGYVLAPLRGLGQPTEFKICRSVKYANSRTQRTAAPACKDCRRRYVSNDSAGTLTLLPFVRT